MPKATFRFYEELNDYLPEVRKKADFQVDIVEKTPLGHVIDALGVPRAEVDLILANGNSVDFQYRLQGGDRISVYPVFEKLDIAGVTRISGRPLRRTKFIADVDLGKVATRMRGAGFDIYFDASLSKRQMIEISVREKRIVLTRDRELLRSKGITRVILVGAGKVHEEVRRIMDQLGFDGSRKPRDAPYEDDP